MEEARLSCPAELLHRVIGPSGAILRWLEFEGECSIRIDQKKHVRTICIQAPKPKLGRAVKLVTHILADSQFRPELRERQRRAAMHDYTTISYLTSRESH